MSENVHALKQRIEHYGASDKDWEMAKQLIKEEAEERERQKAKDAKARRLWQEKQMQPEVFVPKQALVMHVKENLADFEEKLKTCDLTDLIHYKNELKTGKHIKDFRGKNVSPVIFLIESHVVKRQTAQKNEILESVKKLDVKVDHIKKRLNPDPTEKSKPYTT
jgi:hypothetical protein